MEKSSKELKLEELKRLHILYKEMYRKFRRDKNLAPQVIKIDFKARKRIG